MSLSTELQPTQSSFITGLLLVDYNSNGTNYIQFIENPTNKHQLCALAKFLSNESTSKVEVPYSYGGTYIVYFTRVNDKEVKYRKNNNYYNRYVYFKLP